MSKHLLYLGYTGKAHRVALFDTGKVIAKSIPIKDVPVLSDDLEFLNCTVKDGVPYPNLHGAKVVCSVPDVKDNKARFTVYDTRNSYDGKKAAMNLVDFYAFKRVKPKYDYGWQGDGKGIAFAGFFRYFYKLDFWDGTCDDKTMFYLGELAVPEGKRYKLTDNSLCLTSTGDLFFMTNNAEGVLSKGGVRFVPIGTPLDFTVPNCYKSGKAVSEDIPILQIPAEQLHKVFWIGRRGSAAKEEMQREGEFIWWGGGKPTAVCDLRRYKKGKVFGISSCAEDASLVILPETAEVVWLGMFYECSSLKAVYIPKTVEKLIVQGLPPRRFRNTTIYSGSPIVEAFCKENGVQFQKCGDSEDMLRIYYKASSDEYISIDEAGAIASLASVGSDKVGVNGTLWSAVLFSCADKGMAFDELHRRYPIVQTCDLPAPQGAIPLVTAGSMGDQGEYSKERTRTFVAALTQFYPLFTGSGEVEPKRIYKCPLGDYSLYMKLDVLRVFKVPAPDREYSRDHYLNHHIAELVDNSTGRVIHRFEANERFYQVMKCLYSACVGNLPPSAVLRYAEKLPVTKIGDYGRRGDSGIETFSRELLYSCLAVMYGLKNGKMKVAGIDLYTGELVILDAERSYGRGTWNKPEAGTTASLSGIYAIRGLKRIAEDEPVAQYFGTKCEYEIRRRAKRCAGN